MKKIDKQPMKISRSGRTIKRSQKVITTSSDDAPPLKLSKKSSGIDEELASLKDKLETIKAKRLNTLQSPIIKSVHIMPLDNPKADKFKTGCPSISGEQNLQNKHHSPTLHQWGIKNGNDIESNESLHDFRSDDLHRNVSEIVNLFNKSRADKSETGCPSKFIDPNFQNERHQLTLHDTLGTKTVKDFELNEILQNDSESYDVDESLKVAEPLDKSEADKKKSGCSIISENPNFQNKYRDPRSSHDMITITDLNQSGSNNNVLGSNNFSRILGISRSSDRTDDQNSGAVNAPEFSTQEVKVVDAVSLRQLQGTLDIVLEQNVQILSQQELILKELTKNRIESEKKLSESLLTPLTGFPLDTVEQFKELNSDEKKNDRVTIHKHLVNMGGVTLRQFLANSLKQIMTDNLVCSFTWNGGDNTVAFGDTKVSNVLFQSAKKCVNFDGPANKEIFKNHMLEILRHTKQRHRKRLRKNQPEKDDDADITALEERIARLEAARNSNFDATSENNDESYDDVRSDGDDSYSD